MSYLFASNDNSAENSGRSTDAQLANRRGPRTGIPIPGVGFTGEMVKIDPQKVEAKKVGFEWVVMAGTEVLGNFGATEWAARDAARTIKDASFTEYCRLGGLSDLTFFLERRQSPDLAPPFNAQGRVYDLTSLKVQPTATASGNVTEGGKPLFEVGSQREGEVVIVVLKAYGFDQLAQTERPAARRAVSRFW